MAAGTNCQIFWYSVGLPGLDYASQNLHTISRAGSERTRVLLGELIACWLDPAPPGRECPAPGPASMDPAHQTSTTARDHCKLGGGRR